jgi:hypothetical protein
VIRFVGHRTTPELDVALEGLLHDGAPAREPLLATPPPNELSLTLRDGSTFTLAQRAGTPVALTFISPWCDSYLAKTRPVMSQACIAHARQVDVQRRAHAGMTWLTVAHPVWTSPEDLDSYTKKYGDSLIAIDDHAAWFEHFSVRDVPTTILLDSRGAVVARIGGSGDALADALARLH